jgi:hypothetical protein
MRLVLARSTNDLGELYELRLDAHYRAQAISQAEVQQGLKTVVDVMQLVQQTTKNFAEENP